MVGIKMLFLIKPRWRRINFVVYVFHRKVILDDVSFTVLPGQTVALVSPEQLKLLKDVAAYFPIHRYCMCSIVDGAVLYIMMQYIMSCSISPGGAIGLWEEHHHSTHLPLL